MTDYPTLNKPKYCLYAPETQQTLDQAVLLALCAASTCWKLEDDEQLFDTGQALRIGQELVSWFAHHYAPVAGPPVEIKPPHCPRCGMPYTVGELTHLQVDDKGSFYTCTEPGRPFINPVLRYEQQRDIWVDPDKVEMDIRPHSTQANSAQTER